MSYADERMGKSITQSDMLNDVLDFANIHKHDEFLEWAGEALGVKFVYDYATDGYRVAPRTTNNTQVVRADPTDESQAQFLATVREARQVNALSERPSVNAPEGAWCTKCVRFHTLWGCDDLECVYCYEGGHHTLHVPTGMDA
jgi:hypothetical protein